MLAPSRSRFGAVAGAVLLGCLGSLSACGNPTITPAGQAGMEIAYQDPLGPAAATTTSAAGPSTAVTTSGGKAKPGAAKAPKPDTVKPIVTVAPTHPSRSPAKTTTADTAPATRGARPKGPAKTATLTLPQLGEYRYAMSGSTSLGPPPATMRLTVEEGAQPGEQLWTLDGRRADGSGLTEELTLARGADGMYLHHYRLDASTGLAGLILEFNPDQPLLFEPDKVAPGDTWKFDMTSTDGCARASSTAEAIEVGTTRHIQLTTSLSTVGPSSCSAVSGQRVQDFRHPAAQILPSRIDSDLHGSMANIPVKATTRADNPTGPKPAENEVSDHVADHVAGPAMAPPSVRLRSVGRGDGLRGDAAAVRAEFRTARRG
jgi:hypothetical protein